MDEIIKEYNALGLEKTVPVYWDMLRNIRAGKVNRSENAASVENSPKNKSPALKPPRENSPAPEPPRENSPAPEPQREESPALEPPKEPSPELVHERVRDDTLFLPDSSPAPSEDENPDPQDDGEHEQENTSGMEVKAENKRVKFGKRRNARGSAPVVHSPVSNHLGSVWVANCADMSLISLARLALLAPG